jgi:hypothetical protein
MIVSWKFIHPSNCLQKDKDRFVGYVYFEIIQKHFTFCSEACVWNLGIIFLRSNRAENFLGLGSPFSLEHTRSRKDIFIQSFLK